MAGRPDRIGRGKIRPLLRAATVIACLATVQCGGGNSATGPTPPTTTPPGDPGPPPTTPPPSGPQIFVGAGDIAMCDALEPARQTAQVVRLIGGMVFTLGDNAYMGGTAQEFRQCYDPTWGTEKYRTRPTPGNHEYEGGNAGGPYFEYFGSQAGPPGLGYYSFDVGSWRAIALNTNIASSENSGQGLWLKAELAANRAKCTIAYFHHPLFSSGQNGPQSVSRDFWRLLYAAGVDVIMSGHDHLYERFGPQDPDGRPDNQRGIREFVVGSGGAMLYQFTTRAPNSERQIRAYGVLKLTLDSDTYTWEFVQPGGVVGDSGVGQCH